MRKALKKVLIPFVRFSLRHSFKLPELHEALKEVLILEAAEQLKKSGNSVNDSRISLMTGVHRKDVSRILKGAKVKESVDTITRVIGQWRQDSRFSSAPGRPRALLIEGDSSEFAKMVRSVSVDYNSYTVLHELERIGAIQIAKGRAKLTTRIHNLKRDTKRGFSLLAADLSDLTIAVEENLLTDDPIPNLHLRAEYDNIDPRHIKKIKKWLVAQGSAFQQKVSKYLASHDRDINGKPTRSEDRARVSVGTFSVTEIHKTTLRDN